MSKGIKVSQNHGVNPSIPLCYWCGEEKNEVVLLGKLKGDVAAPMNVVLDYEPCGKCVESREKGVTLLEVVTEPAASTQPPIGKDGGVLFYPTSNWAVITAEAAIRLFGEDCPPIICLHTDSFQALHKKCEGGME